MTDVTLIIKQINEIVRRTKADRMYPVKLLAHANDLQAIIFNLTDLYIDARAESKRLEVQLESAEDDSFMKYRREDKVAEATAKILARIDARDLLLRFTDAEQYTTKLWMLRDDVNNQISILQSYSKSLQTIHNQKPV